MAYPKKPERKPGETDSDFSARIEAWIVRLEAAKEKRRKYYTENAERIREQRRKRRAEHLAQCREHDREYNRKYRAENAEKFREYRRKYYAEHAERERERNRKCYAEHAELYREYSRKYRAENAERVRERERKYRAKHAEQRRERCRKWHVENVEHVREYRTENVERVREYVRKYRAENAEKFREYRRKYRAENIEKFRERARRYCAENAERRRERERERYAKKLGLSRAEYLKTIRHARGVKASFGEAVVCCYLESAGIKFEREKAFDWLRNSETGRMFRCDFYLPDLGTVIEYNGPQHYGYRIHGCFKPEDLARRMVMDAEKTEKITARGLRLIAIPGDEIRKAEQIRLYLARELASDGRADSK